MLLGDVPASHTPSSRRPLPRQRRSHFLHVGAPRQPRWRIICTATLAAVTLLLLCFNYRLGITHDGVNDRGWAAAPFASSQPPFVPLPPPRALRPVVEGAKFSSLEELRRWCAATAAPALIRASWVVNGTRHVEAAGRPRLRYPVTDEPVCLSHRVVLLADAHADDGENDGGRGSTGGSAWHMLQRSSVPVRPLTDSFFAEQTPTGGVTAVPAMALLAQGNFIANHVVHMIRDVVEALYLVMHTFNGGELLRVPTQAVLLRSRTTDWGSWGDDGAVPRRRQEARRPLPLRDGSEWSSFVLNAFSSLSAGGPFFNTSVPFHYGGASPAGEGQSGRAPYCFCQGAVVTPKTADALPGDVYGSIQKTIAAQFPHERPYGQVFATPAEEERDRLQRLPSGESPEQQQQHQQWWLQRESPSPPSSGVAASPPPGNATHHPRALFVHRRSRRIRDVGAYTTMLREVGFRVVEVYPETLSLAGQYHLGRHADLVVGMHGQGLVHGLWLDTHPPGCRTVVEFLPWVHGVFPVHFRFIFGTHLGLGYHALHPTDVVLAVDDPAQAAAAKARLMDPRNAMAAFRSPTFANQTCVYDAEAARRLFQAVHRHLLTCLP